MFLERMRPVVPTAVMAGRCAKGFAASKAVGLRVVDLSGGSRIRFSKEKMGLDFGSYARAAAKISFAHRVRRRHIQSVQTTPKLAPFCFQTLPYGVV